MPIVTARGGLLFLDNVALTATLSGGVWAKPLSSLLDPRLRGRPARCAAAADLVASQFLAVLDRPRTMTGLALVDHTLPDDALYRVTTYADAAATEVWAVTEWLPSLEMTIPPSRRRWSDGSFWSGRQRLPGYPQLLLHLPATPLWGAAVRVEIDARSTAGGSFDLGYLTLGQPFEAEWNYAWGRRVGVDPRTLLDETPGGALVADRRRPRRTAAVTFDGLTKAEAYALYDAALALGTHGPVLWVPDPDDGVNRVRESWLGTFKAVAEPVQHEGVDWWEVSVQLQEVLG